MMNEFQPRPLPTFDDYRDAANSVQQKMENRGMDARIYFLSIGAGVESAKCFARNAVSMANAVEPVDVNTGEYADTQRRRGRALYLGALAGYSILYEIYNVSLPSSKMLTYVPPLAMSVKPGNIEHNIDALHNAILSAGDEGRYYLGAEANTRVISWSEQAVTLSEHRPTFLAATGLITVAGVEMQSRRIRRFEQHLDQDDDLERQPDWDAALIDLIEGKEK